jgi:hypothetical protein
LHGGCSGLGLAKLGNGGVDMKLETPLLDKFLAVTSVAGTEVNFSVRTPGNEVVTFDMNALFREMHAALHSLHHFMDPGGAHHTGYPVIVRTVKAEDNPTAQAMIGSP